jgi:chromosome partitioning protein
VRKLAVANFKGGVGKTTLAVNLATVLARDLNRRVLLVDTDPSANIAAHLRAKPEKTLYHLILEEATLDQVMIPAGVTDRLMLIPSSRATHAAEFQVAGQVGRERILDQRFRDLNGFDYLIFDTPPSVSIMAQNAFVCARSVLIPVSMDPMSLLGASTAMALLGEIERGLEVRCPVLGIVPTFVDSRLVIHKVVMQAIGARLGNLPLWPGVRSDTAVRKAIASQTPIVVYDPKSRAAEDFRKLAEHLEGLPPATYSGRAKTA